MNACTVQVHADFDFIGKGSNLATLAVYGGAEFRPQETALRRGVDIVVGTPGRVKDHMERGNLDLSEIRWDNFPGPCCAQWRAVLCQHDTGI